MDKHKVYQSAEEEIDLLPYLRVVKKYRWMIAGICCMAMVVSGVVCQFLPPIYSASTSIFPSQTEKTIPLLASGMGAAASEILGIKSNSTKNYIDMLESRTLADAIVRKLDLLTVYNVKTVGAAIGRLKKNTGIRSSNTIDITVEDKDPQQAADIANAYIDELEFMLLKFNVSGASQQRLFLEKRLKEAEKTLSDAEQDLKRFQEDNKIVEFGAQTSISVQSAARLKSQIIETEIELKSQKGFFTKEKNQVIILNQKLAELKSQLAKIELGLKTNPRSSANPNDKKEINRDNFYVPFNQAPTLGLQLGRLKRKVKILETVYELLTKEHELSKISEAKESASIQILDRAIVAEGPSKPNKRIIIAMSGFIAFTISIFLAFIVEYIEKIKPPKAF